MAYGLPKSYQNRAGKMKLPILQLGNGGIIILYNPLYVAMIKPNIGDVVKEYSLTQFTGGIRKMHTASADAIEWMKKLDVLL